jgi:hypothetical protein
MLKPNRETNGGGVEETSCGAHKRIILHHPDSVSTNEWIGGDAG